MMKKMMLILAIAAIVSTAGAGVRGQLGVLDVTANGGINPNTGTPWQIGDQYRLAFFTAGKITAESNDPNVYNDFVTAEAGLAGLSGNWFAMATVYLDPDLTGATSPRSDVKDNTGTADLTGGAGIGGAGVPVYAMDGSTCIARNNADIWNAWSNPFDGDAVIRLAAGTTNNDSDGNPVTASQNVHYSPFLNQYGLGDTANVHGVDIWTGCSREGNLVDALGLISDKTSSTRGSSNANNTSRIWQRFTDAKTSNRSLYTISEPLTIVDAAKALAVFPIDGQTGVLAADPLTLEWQVSEPNDFNADVFFGTDPGALSPVATVPADGLNVTTADVSVSTAGTYYWKVDVTVVGEPNTVTGDIWSFEAITDTAPEVSILTPDMATWSDEPVALDATITDDGESTLTYGWTADPDGTGDPNLTVSFDPGAEDPVVTVTNTTGATQNITMTLSAFDETNTTPVEASVIIEVAVDECAMAKNQGYGFLTWDRSPGRDCKVDLLDLAGLTSQWLIDILPTGPETRQ